MRPLFGKSKSKDIHFYEFEELDEQQIKKELKIYQRAKENGKINLPTSDSKDRDNVQNEIISYFESLRDVNSNRLNDSIKAWHNEISALKLSLDFARLESIPRKLDANYNGLKCTEIITLKEYYQKLLNIKKERADFKNKNGIDRSADYPESNIFSIALLLFIFLVEVIFNSVFFAKGSSLGFIGGITEAVSISIVNVGIALFTGMFILPMKNNNSLISKTFSVTCVFMILLLLFIFNLLSAHYREAFILNPMEAMSVFDLKVFINNPLGLTDFKSWILVIIGFFVVLISMYKGYRFDDPFPKFGKIDRKVKSIENVYYSLVRDLEQNIFELKENALKKVERLQNKIETKSEIYTRVLLSNNYSIDSYINFESKLDLFCNRLLSYYESTNIDYRQDDPPDYFGNSVKLTKDTKYWDNKKIQVDNDIQKKYETLNTSINQIEENIVKQYKDFLLEFEAIRNEAK